MEQMNGQYACVYIIECVCDSSKYIHDHVSGTKSIIHFFEEIYDMPIWPLALEWTSTKSPKD